MKNYLFIALIALISISGFSQEKQIQIIHSDNTFVDQEKYPNAIVALGNVKIEHDGATLSCKQALIYQKANLIKAFGDVFINQGDTITQKSKYVHYDGRTKIAKSWGNVILKDPSMTLSTDTLEFDRTKQLLYYEHHATIKDKKSTLESNIGRYHLNQKKFQALSQVVIIDADSKVTSNHLDYYTDTGISYLYGPSTIEDTANKLYCENGFHNSRTNISHFTKNARIHYNDRLIEGDSLYYNKNKKFASATGNIKVTDTINNSILKGGYAEYFEKLDSVFVVKKAVAINLVEKDSTFIHGDTLMVTGKTNNRIVRAFHHVKFFKKNLQGKCDSLYSNESKGITKMYRRPVLWNKRNQITGDSLYFTSNIATNKLDSLKVYNKAFVVNKDSIDGFNQIKGKFIYGKFNNDELDNLLVIGNAESIFYIRDDETEDKELIGINKMASSEIFFQMKDGELYEATYKVEPNGNTYPESKYPDAERTFKNFTWRESERPLTKNAIFTHDKEDKTLIPTIILEEKKAKKEAREKAIRDAKRLLEMSKTKNEKSEKKKNIDTEIKDSLLISQKTNRVLLLKVDYKTTTFEGGKELEFEDLPNFTITTTYNSPSDFGSVQLYYKEVNKKLFDGTIVWAGKGKRQFPEVMDLPDTFEKTTNRIPIHNIDLFENVMYSKANHYPKNIDYLELWNSINNLEIVSEYLGTNPEGKIRFFLYTPSVGIGNPADFDWYIILKN